MTDQIEVGFIKYSGKAVSPEVLDAGSAGKALTGLDDLLRYFNTKQSIDLAKADYQLPVTVRDGSWEAVVLAATGLVAAKFALTYVTESARQMAKQDFEGVDFKDIFKKSLDATIQLVRLIKHTHKRSGWALEKLRWKDNNTEVGIPNSEGEYQYFSTDLIKWYKGIDPGMMAKLAEVIEEERALTIAIKDEGEIMKSETATIMDKRIFTGETEQIEEEGLLFPELEHGAEVKLEGVLVRGNVESNSIGLHYREHTLNCVPREGNISQYKPALFLRCLVEGEITRFHKPYRVLDRRPTIIVRRITTLERDNQHALF